MSNKASFTDGILSVENLRKAYTANEGTVTAVENVSLNIQRGEIVGLLGPNGAGKTTTIKSILGLIEPTDGHVEIAGVDPHEDPTKAYHYVSAVLEGARNIYWRLTVRENLRYFAGLQGIRPNMAKEEIDRLISLVDLEDKVDETVQNLSRGMQQKACIVCALVRETPVVFLDEPTLGLDVKATRAMRSEVRRLVDEENRTIVLSSHDMDVIQDICDRVLIMNDGRIIEENSVESLIELFNTQSYRVTLAEPLSPDVSLNSFGPDWEADTVFKITLADSSEFYHFINRCETLGAEIQKIDSLEADLEEIFVSIVDYYKTDQENNTDLNQRRNNATVSARRSDP